jgi:hypothetical protein
MHATSFACSVFLRRCSSSIFHSSLDNTARRQHHPHQNQTNQTNLTSNPQHHTSSKSLRSVDRIGGGGRTHGVANNHSNPGTSTITTRTTPTTPRTINNWLGSIICCRGDKSHEMAHLVSSRRKGTRGFRPVTVDEGEETEV